MRPTGFTCPFSSSALASTASSPVWPKLSGNIRNVSASESPSTVTSICSVNSGICNWPGILSTQSTMMQTSVACSVTTAALRYLGGIAFWIIRGR